MGRFPKLVLVGAIALLLPLVAQRQAADEEILEDPTFSLDVKVVNLLATVKDGKGLLVNSLTKDDFHS